MALTGKDVLKLVVDADTSGAVREFDKLGRTANKELGDAEKKSKGFSGAVTSGLDKLVAKSPLAATALDKVGLSTAQLGAVALPALATGAAVAGTAIATFGAKSISQFQKTALAADKFRDTTGLSIEESSKWIAVANDVGVSADTFRSAFSKMQRAIDTNRAAFGDLVATAKDGSVDMSATFLNAIEHLQGIDDPIERANEAAKLFGRGWQEISQIITTDATELTAALEGVSDAQVIDEDEVEKARRYEAAMDSLQDAVLDIQIAFGEGLAPAVADAAEGLAGFINLANSVTGPIGGIGKAIETVARNAPILGSGFHIAGVFEEGATGVDRFGSAVGVVVPVLGNFIKSLDGSRDAIENVIPPGVQASWDRTAESVRQNAAEARALAQTYVNFAEDGQRFRGTADGIAQDLQVGAEAAAAFRIEQDNLNNSLLASLDTGFKVRAAQQAYIDAQTRANEATQAGTTSQLEQQIAVDQAVQSALIQAQATAEYAGVADDATLKNQVYIDTLSALADEATGPVKDGLNVAIDKLEEFGEQNPEATINVNDQATPLTAAAKAKLDAFDIIMATATVTVEDRASGRLDAIISRANRINGMRIVAGVGSGLAGGTRDWRGGWTMVGEAGPELVNLPKGSDVYTASESRSMMSAPNLRLSGGGGGPGQTVNNFTVTTLDPISAAREIKKVLAQGTRVGVS